MRRCTLGAAVGTWRAAAVVGSYELLVWPSAPSTSAADAKDALGLYFESGSGLRVTAGLAR